MPLRPSIRAHVRSGLLAAAAGAAATLAIAFGCARWSPMRETRSLVPGEAARMPAEGISGLNASTAALGLIRIDEGLGRDFVALDAADLTARTVVARTRGARCQAGWPWRSMAAVVDLPAATVVVGSGRGAFFRPGSFLPRPAGPVTVMRPLWPGFAADTALFGGLCWTLVMTPGFARRALRRGRGCCIACGYPRGLAERCTECGAPLGER